MKTILILGLVLLSTQVLCDNIDCTTLTQQAQCQNNSSTCVWINDFTKNLCTQTIDCSQYTQQTCTNQACAWKGYAQGCRNNVDLCKINPSNYSCNTGAGCVQGSSSKCLPVLINKWGCELNSFDNCNTQDKPFCVQAQSCNYNLQKTCPTTVNTATADKDCSGPCKLANFTCQDTCSGSTSQQTCTQPDCQWANNACTNVQTCPTNPKTVNECTSVQNCSVAQTTITCQGPANSDAYQTYCSQLGTGCTDTNYCSQVKACVSDVGFCSKNGSCAKDATSPAPYKQCLLTTTKTCSFPSIDCTKNANKDDCQKVSNNQCLWSDGMTCQNLKSKSDCQLLYRNSTSCNTLNAAGCQFISGGTCASKEAEYLSSKLLAFFTGNIFLYLVANFVAFI
ncbi:hypothetical protein ABPG74_007224 [Tetrahymena malaccensis]